MKTASAPLSISLSIHLLIIASLIVINFFFVSGEKLVTINLAIEDCINCAVAGPEKSIGSEIKEQGSAIKKPLPEVHGKKVIDRPKQRPVEPVANQPGPTVAQQDLLTGTEAPAVIPVAENQSSGNNTSRESGSANTASGTGSESSGMREKTEYTNQHFAYIRELVQGKAFYPKIAMRMEWEGQVVVSFIILLDGGVKDIRVAKSSGRELLDKSAMEAVKLSAPFPRPPATVELKVPVTYKLL